MHGVRHRPDPPAVERAANGLRVRGHALYLEPRGRPPLGFLAHARGAPPVLPQRMVTSGPTSKLLEAALPRALRRSAALSAAYGQAFALGSLRLTLHPAGHVLGSAQIRCEADGLDLVYVGDIGGTGSRAPATAEPFQQLRCETLAIRAVYGHPRYVFPAREPLLERLEAFIDGSLRDGKLPVIVAAAIGVAQEVVRFLGERRTLRLHPTAFRACEVYVAQGQQLRGFVRLDEEGDVVMVPPTVRLARLDLRAHRICALSGRAVDGIAGADEALPLADHAGFDELLQCIRASGAKRVLTIDGHAEDLARAARALGIDAAAVREQHQLSLPGL
jgi:putative mRNA 3-end processing factor